MIPAPRPHLLLSLPLLLSACAGGPHLDPDGSSGALPVVATLAEARAFEIEDYYRTAFVGAPKLTPRGEQAVFSVRRYDIEHEESWSEIWIMDVSGGQPQRMTSGRHNDSSPTVSPDGTRILFVSDRSESSQLWSMPIDGGDPSQLTDFPGGVSAPRWSPDGRWIAVTAELWPACGADPECNEQRNGEAEANELKVHVADDLLYRHWTSWGDGKVSHVLLIDAESGEVVRDLTPGTYPAPTFSLGGDRGYDFSPDGEHLVFVSNHDEQQAESTNADLWIVATAAEEPRARNLTEANDGWDGAPLFSPDGRYLAYISQETPGYESDLRRLMLLELASGKARPLTDRDIFDDMVGDMRWSEDGSRLYFQCDQEGRTPIFSVFTNRSPPQLVHRDATIAGWEPLPDQAGLIYTRRAVGSPPEIYRSRATGTSDRLTHFNAALEQEVDIRPAEEMWVEGEGDYRIHVFLVRPHDFDPSRRYPLILNVHGGPQGQWTDAYRGDWQVYPGKGYVVAFANPTGSTGYGQDYCDAIGGDWGGRVYRDLMKVTDALAELPYVDSKHMGAMGWSYGGYMMMWMQGHTDRFACQAAMMGLFDLESFYGATEELWFPERDLKGTPWTSADYETWSPSKFVENFSTPSLVISGELDYRVPYTQSLMYFTALRKQGIPSRLVIFPNSGHWPGWRDMRFYYLAHLDWFHRWLGGEAPREDLIGVARGRPASQAELVE